MQTRLLIVMLCAALVSACEPRGNPHLADLRSPNGAYTVRLWGRVTRPTEVLDFEEHRLRAEVYKAGELYVPARVIYIADSMDTAFNDRYSRPVWNRADVLQFPGAWGRHEEPPDVLKIRNHSAGLIRTLRIATAQDLFFIFDMNPGAELALPMSAIGPSGDLAWLGVDAEWGGGFSPSSASGSFTLHGGRSARYEFVITVSADGIEFAETRGQSARYR
jgi:hypothetical protein